MRCAVLVAMVASICAGCASGQSQEELSKQFQHPDLYNNADDPFPRWGVALAMKNRGMLHRGMTREQVEQLLGKPDMQVSSDGRICWYSMIKCGLGVKYDDKDVVRCFMMDFDEGGPEPYSW